MYKLIAIDMDGTLLNDQHEVTEGVKVALKEAKAAGAKIVLCTGRPLGGVTRYLIDLELDGEDDYVIAYNGAVVQNNATKESIVSLTLSYQDLLDLTSLAESLATPMHFFDTERLYTTNQDISPYTIYESFVTQVPLSYRKLEEVEKEIALPKIMFIDEPDRLAKTINAIPADVKEKYEMVQSAPFFLEILHPEASKGNAVKHLAEKLGINRDQVMCIGDNGNDLSMIKFAGCGIAMANAIPELKASADVETKSNNEDGVAHAIRTYVLNKA
ncbi:promiscuous sugar phosphatase YidA, haloacid dehalogenase-like phosphatase family [Bacillus sp. JCM 19046]|nr:promiscuous sugar phosphatase YidA, haloacid dehalogenase-like phosphatase family [Bacillus sp. JCM 19045]GAF17494.1 promiscuous sugar phosphatase YidA, haloacid dehalogenase-like phosphatase family [Bacillus sp. JCM 19046]